MNATRELHALIAKFDELARGKLMNEMRYELGRTLDRLALEQWTGHRTPAGAPWLGTLGNTLTLQKKLQLRRSLKVELTPEGIKISIGSRTFGRRTDASVMQYGGLTVSHFTKRSRGAAKVRALFANRNSGKGLMTFLGKKGWRSTYSVHHEANPILPEPGAMPVRWSEAFQETVDRVMERWAPK